VSFLSIKFFIPIFCRIKRRVSVGALGALTLLLLSVVVNAQEQIAASTVSAEKSVQIPNLPASPQIDGVLDDAVWAQAVFIEDFHQYFPQDHAVPTQATEVRMYYSQDALYISARLWETDPTTIAAQVLRQGQALGGDDIIAIVLDPYLDQRNGYRFEVNANGVRWDGLFQNINDVEGNWDGIWEAASARSEQGWTVEIRIPFQTISFDPSINTWGINFNRVRRRNNESIAWVSRNREVNPSIAGTMTGLSGMKQGLGLDVVPSLSMSKRRKFGPGSFSENNYEPSLDVFYKITPQLNAALTINTDFSATEVDDRQVNLTRFNLFFPEKRDFFLRDADIFEFGQIGSGGFNQTSGVGSPATPTPARQNARPFFSRNIGLSSTGTPVDLSVGAKLSGRIGDWNLGTLLISQDESVNTGVAAQNIFVGRGVLNVLNESQVGFIVTDGDPQSNLNSTLVGTDFRYRNSNLPGGKTVEGVAFIEQTNTAGLQGDDSAMGFGINYPNTSGLQGYYNYKRVEENFAPAVGFVNRTGVVDHGLNIGYRHFLKPGGFFRSALAAFDGYRAETMQNGRVSSQNLGLRFSINDNQGDTTLIRITANREVLLTPFTINRSSDGLNRVTLPAGEYSFNEGFWALQMGGQRKITANVFVTGGEYYDGSHFNRRGNITIRPNRSLSFEIAYTEDDIELPYGDFSVQQISLTSQLSISSTVAWSNLVQYDNVSEAMGINSRLHWIPKAGQQAFLVLNWGLTDADKDNSFDSTIADLSLKFNYTFRF
jgi:hypothetical protein